MNTEESLVGALMRNPDELVQCIGRLEVTDFFDSKLSTIYDAMVGMFTKAEAIDLTTVFKRVKEHGIGATFISEVHDLGTKTGIPSYVKSIKSDAKTRRIEKKLTRIRQVLLDLGSESALNEISALLTQETSDEEREADVKSCLTALESTQKENLDRGNIGLDTGWKYLTKKYIYYTPGHIQLWGAFPSVGKTTMMVDNISRFFNANPSGRAAVVSTEMSTDQNMARILARETGVSPYKILAGQVFKGDSQRIDMAKEWLASKHLHTYDNVYKLDAIVSVIRKLHLQGGIDVVWIDYAQNISVKGGSEYEQNDTIAKTLQQLAKQCECTIVLYSQLPNDYESKGPEQQPRFKGAGTYNAVADLGVIMKRGNADKTKIKLEGKKNRHGQKFVQILDHCANWTKLEEAWDDENE